MAQFVAWRECKGRNGWDHPLAIPEDMGAEMLNVTLHEGGLGIKRGGSEAVTLSAALTNTGSAIGAWVPAQNPAASELFIVDTGSALSRIHTGNTRTTLTVADAFQNVYDVSMVGLRGSFYIAYNSAVNRLHRYTSGTALGVAGLAAPGQPAAIANTGAGSYPATLRNYRVAYVQMSGSTVLRRSNLGTSDGFIPSGTGTAARVTKPAAINEGETHWVLYGAELSDGPYYELATTAVATTTYDDSTDPADYSAGEPAPLEGAYYPFPSVKYLLTDGTRLFGFGVWESSAGSSVLPVAGRVYFSPAIGSTDGDDQERVQFTVDQEDYVDVGVNAGGVDRGLGGPVNGMIYVFQDRGIYMLVPTGQATAPFRRVVVTDAHGALTHQSIVMGEDEAGNPALYFLDPNDGPRRLSQGSIVQWLGKDVWDIWQTVNLSATGIAAWGTYDSRNKRVIWAVATGSSNVPDRMIVFDVTHGVRTEDGSIRRGWTTWTGELPASACGVMFASTLAATRPLTKTLYACDSSAAVLQRQVSTATSDQSTAFQAYVTSKAFDWDPIGRTKRILRSFLVTTKEALISLQLTIIRNWGAESRSVTVSIDSSGTETRVRPQCDLDVAGLITGQVTIGDASATASGSWELDRWEAEIEIDAGAIR